MYDVKDKVALVTGAASGIGAGIARSLLEEGAKHVAILDVDVGKGQALENELHAKHGAKSAKFYKCDVTTDELTTAFDNVLSEQGYIDIVVNNAAIMNDHPSVYLKEIDINVTALIRNSMRAFDSMHKEKGGRGGTIINISSIVGLFPFAHLPIYSATKSAVLQFSTCLGMQPYYPKSGVRVITLCFGVTDTALLPNSAAYTDEVGGLLEQVLDSCRKQSSESAVKGVIEAYKRGESASTWLITLDQPAEDITGNIKKAYDIMSVGAIPQKNQK